MDFEEGDVIIAFLSFISSLCMYGRVLFLFIQVYFWEAGSYLISNSSLWTIIDEYQRGANVI